MGDILLIAVVKLTVESYLCISLLNLFHHVVSFIDHYFVHRQYNYVTLDVADGLIAIHKIVDGRAIGPIDILLFKV